MIEAHGTDALRLTLSVGNTPGNDLKFDEENVVNNKLFINKLWNASRFVFTNLTSNNPSQPSLTTNGRSDDISTIEKDLLKNYDKLMYHEKWILSRIRYLSDMVTDAMEEYNFSEAGIELQAFTKNEFCDYYIEEFKLTKEASKYGEQVMLYTMNKLLKLWHPYIPFVTAEIYTRLGFTGDLIEQEYARVLFPRDEEVEKGKQVIIDTIRTIRNLRAENNIPPSKTVGLQIYASPKNKEMLEEVLALIAGIVKADSYELIDNKPLQGDFAYGVVKAGVEVYIDTANALDVEKEKERLKEQITDTKEYIAILDKKLLNESFVKRAPQNLVRAEMEKKSQAGEKLKKLEEKLEWLST